MSGPWEPEDTRATNDIAIQCARCHGYFPKATMIALPRGSGYGLRWFCASYSARSNRISIAMFAFAVVAGLILAFVILALIHR